MTNFNHERFVIAAGALRAARMCYEQSMKYALKRKTFGKRLIDHQVREAEASVCMCVVCAFGCVCAFGRGGVRAPAHTELVIREFDDK